MSKKKGYSTSSRSNGLISFIIGCRVYFILDPLYHDYFLLTKLVTHDRKYY